MDNRADCKIKPNTKKIICDKLKLYFQPNKTSRVLINDLYTSYYHPDQKGTYLVKQLKRAKQTIYNVYNFFCERLFALDYYRRYKNNKKNCGTAYFFI